jgi:hypothetical protein
VFSSPPPSRSPPWGGFFFDYLRIDHGQLL